MRSLAFLSILVLAAACGRQQAPPTPKAEQPTDEAASATEAPPAPPTAEEQADSGDAASALRDYYVLIERGDYEGAAAMRSDRQADAKRLADNFKAYESYRALVGQPGRPARGGDWLWVRVPVMITGSYKGGKEFGSTGSVTLRRSTSAAAAPADRRWRVYSG
jgi:hypothetical protein